MDRSHLQAGYRGLMLDSARCQENRSYYRAAIDFAARRGMNILLWHFTDDQGCSLEFNLPGIASPNAYSKSEMRELVRYARDRGIEMVPELASLGHCRYITRLPAYQHLKEADAHFTGMCPISDETRNLIRSLIEETAEVFDSPNFHVGMDEVNIGQHPLTRNALKTKTRGDLLAEYTRFLHGIVTGLGRRLWMWGDALLKYPDMAAPLPRDIVVCNWQYAPDVTPDTTQTLLDAGFDVMLTSALISHDQPLFPGRQFAEPNWRLLESQRSSVIGRGKILGHITSIWTPARFIANSLWAGVDLAAAVLREGPDVDAHAQIRRFGETFHGLSGDDLALFTEAVQILLDHSPLRAEWRAVAKLQPLTQPQLQRAMTATAAWSKAQDLVLRVSAAVGFHVEEFTALSLLVELLAHTYSVAVYVAGGAPSMSILAEMIGRGQTLIERVDQTWDRERFADDPRKFTAPMASFQDDHLLPLLQTGLNALKKKLEESGPAAIISASVDATESPALALAEPSAA